MNKNENLLWIVYHNDIPNSVTFLEDSKRLLLYHDDGIICYNLETGKKGWQQNVDNTCFPCALYAQENNILYCDIGNPFGIYACDIYSGKSKMLHPLYAHMYSSIKQGSMLYIATSGTPKERPNSINGQYTISSYNLQTGAFRILYTFTGMLFNPMYVAGDSLILPIEKTAGKASLCCINIHTGVVQWDRDIPFRGVYVDSYYIIADKNSYCSLFFIDISAKSGMSLIELDIQTGREVQTFPLPIENFNYNHYAPSINLEFDGNYILIQTIATFLYNIDQHKLTKLNVSLNDNFIVLGLYKGVLIYTDRTAVFAYRLKTKKRINLLYLNKKEIYDCFFSDNYMLFILANNVREDIADHNNLMYILLQQRVFDDNG